MLALFKARSRPRLSPPLAALFTRAGATAPAWSDVEPLIAAPDVAPPIADQAAGLLQDEAAHGAITDRAAIVRNGDASERLAFYALSRLLASEADRRRRALLGSLEAEPAPLDGLSLDRRSGILVTRQGDWSPVADAVSEARAAFARERTDAPPVNPGKRFMTTAKSPPDFLNSKIMALGRHPALLRLAGRYLETLPILYRINLLESANEDLQDASSQFFHIDPEDFRQVKVFLLVEDVDEDTGPLHLLRADASDRVRTAKSHRMGRLDDEAVMAHAPEQALVRCTGPAGTLAIGDTSRCFHFGSRPGRRRRFVVMYQYLTPFAASFPLGGEEVSSKYADPVRRRAAETGQSPSSLEACLFGLMR